MSLVLEVINQQKIIHPMNVVKIDIYNVRKVFWDCISNLIRRGYTSNTAIDKVYSVYGRSNSTSSILKLMRKDKSSGGNPLLN